MSRSFDTLLEPSVSFSCALFSATYSPAGLIFSLSPSLLEWLVFFWLLFRQHVVLLAFGIVFSTVIGWVHRHLSVLELAPTCPPPAVTPLHITRILDGLQRILLALSLHQTDNQEALEDLSTSVRAMITALETDVTATDIDLAAATTHINVLRKCFGVLESNLEMARQILGADIDVSDDGLDMGDDVEMFWNDGAGDDDDELSGKAVVEEEIDVGANDALVEGWLEGCWYPEECEDA
jgi:hypothetical protein